MNNYTTPLRQRNTLLWKASSIETNDPFCPSMLVCHHSLISERLVWSNEPFQSILRRSGSFGCPFQAVILKPAAQSVQCTGLKRRPPKLQLRRHGDVSVDWAWWFDSVQFSNAHHEGLSTFMPLLLFRAAILYYSNQKTVLSCHQYRKPTI